MPAPLAQTALPRSDHYIKINPAISLVFIKGRSALKRVRKTKYQNENKGMTHRQKVAKAARGYQEENINRRMNAMRWIFGWRAQPFVSDRMRKRVRIYDVKTGRRIKP